RSARMCATCHDVSSSHFTRQTDGSYTLNATGQTPAASKYDQFPEQRTFSEWSQSLFGAGAVALNGRFGGHTTSYSTCQDCHIPKPGGGGCRLQPPTRGDLPLHNFNGANTWVLDGIQYAYNYDNTETQLQPSGVEDSQARAVAMLQAASDTTVSQSH